MYSSLNFILYTKLEKKKNHQIFYFFSPPSQEITKTRNPQKAVHVFRGVLVLVNFFQRNHRISAKSCSIFKNYVI